MIYMMIYIYIYVYILPVVVLFAVDGAVLAEAGQLGLQRQFTLAALEASQVPALVHRQQVEAVRDAPPAAGTQSRLLRAQRGHGLEETNNHPINNKARPVAWSTHHHDYYY